MNAMRRRCQTGRGGAVFLAAAVFLLSSAQPVSAAFEDLGAGARPVGMGSAFSAVADDANTVYYNPAGLGQLKHPQLTAGYGRLALGLADDSNIGNGYLAGVIPLRNGAWGTLGVDAMDLQLTGAYRENAFSVAYGRAVRSGLSAGGSLKLLRRSYGSDAYTAIDPLFQQHGKTADAVSLDLGLLYRRSRHYVFALTAKDANAPDVGLGSTDRVPTTWKGAFSYYQRSYVMSAEIARKNGDNNLGLGTERWFFKHQFAGRGGLDFGAGSKRNLSVGASFRIRNAQLDYAFLLPLAGVTDTAGTHRLSMTVRFGSSDGSSVALLEQEELLGPETGYEGMADMQKQLDRVRRESGEYRKETEGIQKRIAELEQQLHGLKEAQALAPVATAVPVPAPAPSLPAEPAPVAAPIPASVPVVTPVSVEPVESPAASQRVERMEEELARLRAELEKRRQERAAKTAAPAPAGVKAAFKRPGPYAVQEGDTLRSIAQKTLGDSGRWIDIFQANKDRIKRGGEVTPGQVLDIP